MRKVTMLAAILCAFAVPAWAQLKEYHKWAESPEAYFLTAAEREEWSRVRSDKEAGAFVAQYFERRGSDFQKELAHRIEMTDKYLSIGKKKGSATTRGKLAIVFGPPTKLDRTLKSRSADRSGAITPMVDAGGEGASPTGMSLGDATQAATGMSAIGATASTAVVETMVWSGERLPKPLTEPVTVRIEVDSAGREKIQGSKEELAKLDASIESLARASIRAED